MAIFAEFTERGIHPLLDYDASESQPMIYNQQVDVYRPGAYK